MEKLTTFDPATGQQLAEYPVHTPAQLDELLKSSRAEFLRWRATERAERALTLNRVAELLLREKQELAALMTAEMGKLPQEAVAEIEKCAAGAKYYADHGGEQLAPLEVPTEA